LLWVRIDALAFCQENLNWNPPMTDGEQRVWSFLVGLAAGLACGLAISWF
jgi:hypothetical protein